MLSDRLCGHAGRDCHNRSGALRETGCGGLGKIESKVYFCVEIIYNYNTKVNRVAL